MTAPVTPRPDAAAIASAPVPSESNTTAPLFLRNRNLGDGLTAKHTLGRRSVTPTPSSDKKGSLQELFARRASASGVISPAKG